MEFSVQYIFWITPKLATLTFGRPRILHCTLFFPRLDFESTYKTQCKSLLSNFCAGGPQFSILKMRWRGLVETWHCLLLLHPLVAAMHSVTCIYILTGIYQICDLYCCVWIIMISFDFIRLLTGKSKTSVSPLLTHWRYCSLPLTHRYNFSPNI